MNFNYLHTSTKDGLLSLAFNAGFVLEVQRQTACQPTGFWETTTHFRNILSKQEFELQHVKYIK